MEKDFYVYFSDYEYTREFRDHPNFVHPSHYDQFEYQKMPQEEYGKLQLRNGLTLKLILDNGRNKKCPWCDCPSQCIKKTKSVSPYHEGYQAECISCGARGPVFNISTSMNLEDEIIKSEVEDMIKQRWACRIPKGKELSNG